MSRNNALRRFAGLAALSLALCCAGNARAGSLIANGGFESGLVGWTTADLFGGGGWFLQSGTTSPLNGFAVPAPPEGLNAAMTDQFGPDAHVLYQDFVVPTSLVSATLSFQLFLQNLNGAYSSPDTLDISTGDANQQARVDIITTTANPFSVAAGDVLQNIYQTMPGDAATSGYSLVSADVTATLLANLGQTLRLRFAEADNQFFFNVGVDAVSLATVEANAVPEPSTLASAGLGLLVCGGLAWRRRRATR